MHEAVPAPHTNSSARPLRRMPTAPGRPVAIVPLLCLTVALPCTDWQIALFCHAGRQMPDRCSKVATRCSLAAWERAEGKLQPWHRDRLAAVYVRPPTAAQVQDHAESSGCSRGSHATRGKNRRFGLPVSGERAHLAVSGRCPQEGRGCWRPGRRRCLRRLVRARRECAVG
jgi:hypothetical protein